MTAIRLAGSGGQGIQLAAIVLGEAATRAGFYVACSQNYGPQSRGGASRADVLVSREEIDYPKARRLDLLVALSAKAARASAGDLSSGGLAIFDLAVPVEVSASGASLYRLPMVRSAIELGSPLMASVVALGVVSAVTAIVSEDDLVQALEERIRKETSRNREALRAGLRLGALVACGKSA